MDGNYCWMGLRRGLFNPGFEGVGNVVFFFDWSLCFKVKVGFVGWEKGITVDVGV